MGIPRSDLHARSERLADARAVVEAGYNPINDDTAFTKAGSQHSVGVAHQYCGQLGNRIAVSQR
jgi:SRSO17 transposase